jgi:hypothetical protein
VTAIIKAMRAEWRQSLPEVLEGRDPQFPAPPDRYRQTLDTWVQAGDAAANIIAAVKKRHGANS